MSSPPSWVQGDQGQCGCRQRWPLSWHQPGNLCALSKGLRGQGTSATSGPPSSSRCSGDSDVRPCSNVPILHSPAGAPAGASVPPLEVLRTGFGLCPFGKRLGCHCVLSQQHPPISTQLVPGAVGPATAVASELPPIHAAIQRAGSPCSHVPPSPAALCASPPEGPGLLLFPQPQPMLAPLGCNTNCPVPAGHREPQNPPHYFWGESCLHAQLPQALGPGNGMVVTAALGAWGQQHCSRPNPLVPFVSQPGMGRVSLRCPQ